jgi:hypothetical protein
MAAMRTDQSRVNIRRIAMFIFVSIITVSCSEKSAPDRKKITSQASGDLGRQPGSEKAKREGELRPNEDQIAEDCDAFVRSTKVVPARAVNTDCPECPARGIDVLSFRHMKTDAVSCSGDTCNVVVTIFSVFNPGAGATMIGGLTAWIPPEQRSAYVSGQTPSGEQAYRVQITYKRRGTAWRAVEFDRAPAG